MVEANDFQPFQEHSARQLPNLSCMNASLDHAQQDFLSACMNTGTCKLPPPGLKDAAHSKFNLQEANGALGFRSLPQVCLQNMLPTPILNIETKGFVAPCGHGEKPDPNKISGSFGKKYLIFDQCGNNMRMMFSSVCSPPVYPITAAVKNYDCKLDEELQIATVDGFDSIKSNLNEEYDENYLRGEGSDMHEDTQEINALLYSDDDEDLEDDDEVMSTGHSPNMPKRTYEKLEHFDDHTDEVDSFRSHKKRQKVLQGEDKKLLLAENGEGLRGYHSDAESNIQEEDMNSSAGNELSKKAKIREKLKMLECIVPGAEGKDPLLIIDEAIDYLKSLKHRAVSLGMLYQ